LKKISFTLQLVKIKDEQTQAITKLQEARMELTACSYIADPAKWSTLFTNCLNLSERLTDITRELQKIEGRLVLFPITHFTWFVSL
jgi:hypothetical protein